MIELIVLYFLIVLLFASNFFLWVELKAMQRSTHQVQYVNLPNQEFEKMTTELKQTLTKDIFENNLN